MERHLDLVRNNWDKDVQERVAQITLGAPGDIGVIVRGETVADWDSMIRDAVGDQALESSERVAALLAERFHNGYLFVTALHTEEECPFSGGPVSMERHDVAGDYALPGVGPER